MNKSVVTKTTENTKARRITKALFYKNILAISFVYIKTAIRAYREIMYLATSKE